MGRLGCFSESADLLSSEWLLLLYKQSETTICPGHPDSIISPGLDAARGPDDDDLYGDLYADVGQGKKVLKTELQEVQRQAVGSDEESNLLRTQKKQIFLLHITRNSTTRLPVDWSASSPAWHSWSRLKRVCLFLLFDVSLCDVPIIIVVRL